VLTSPTAIYHTETRDVYLNGGVRARNSKGMEFTTRSVRFMGTLGIVTTTDAVRFSDEDLTLEGVGMEFNVASSALKVTKDVTAVMRGGKHH
jgi:LPS export ABC transporter protein LptC